MVGRVIACTAVWLVLAGMAQGKSDPAEAFGARESVEQISLSPDGTKIAYIAPRAGQGAALYTVNLSNGQSQVATSVDGNPQRLDRCDWVSNDRLVCRVYALVKAIDILPVSRMIALDADGKNLKVLAQSDSVNYNSSSRYGGSIIGLVPDDSGSVLMDRQHGEAGTGIVKIDTRSLDAKEIEKPIRYGSEFFTDSTGQLRLMGTYPPAPSGYAGSKVHYFYRTTGSSRWRPLGSYDVEKEDGVNPYAIDSKANTAYVLRKLDGRQSLYRLTLEETPREELVFAHPHVDVASVIRIGRDRRPVGASYVTDKREAIYFDPELKKLATSLAKSMSKLPLIRFVDSSANEEKLLLWAGSDTDPGRYFVFDKKSRQLSEILLARPQLDGVALSPVKAITYRAADGTDVPAYLTLPQGKAVSGLPAIVMPHGGPSARDEWGFDWLAQYFAAKGYAVLQPNFRGSSGYGDSWFQKNGFQSWRTAIGDVNDAGRWLVAQGIAAPSKLAIMGWSYGGYAALQSGVLEPNLYKAVIAVAPVTDLEMLREESRHWSNFYISKRFIGSGLHIREGSPAQNAAKLSAPVLLFHGEFDRNVGITQSKRMADRLRSAGKKVDLVVYPKLDHYLEDGSVRADMLRKSDAFLRSSLGL